jgi:hypothetical protein
MPTYKGPYSPDYDENPLNCDQNNSYYPGPTPGKFVSNVEGKNSIKLSPNVVEADWVATQAWRNSQADWHKAAGFSEEVPTPPDTDHPTKSRVSSWPSRGTDTRSANQGSPKGGKFGWR